MRLEVVLDAVNVIIIHTCSCLPSGMDDVRCNCESGEISIVAYLLRGSGVEVALDCESSECDNYTYM